MRADPRCGVARTRRMALVRRRTHDRVGPHTGAGHARVGPRTPIAVVARRSIGLPRRRARAGRRIARTLPAALVDHWTHDRFRPDAGARLTAVRPRALVAVVARRAVGLRGVRAGAGRRVARPGRVTLVGGRARDRVRSGADPVLAGIHLCAGVPVVAAETIVGDGCMAAAKTIYEVLADVHRTGVPVVARPIGVTPTAAVARAYVRAAAAKAVLTRIGYGARVPVVACRPSQRIVDTRAGEEGENGDTVIERAGVGVVAIDVGEAHLGRGDTAQCSDHSQRSDHSQQPTERAHRLLPSKRERGLAHDRRGDSAAPCHLPLAFFEDRGEVGVDPDPDRAVSGRANHGRTTWRTFLAANRTSILSPLCEALSRQLR
jgi:hypothetical protein